MRENTTKKPRPQESRDRTVGWCVGAGVGIFLGCIVYCIVTVGIDQIQFAEAMSSTRPERVPEEIRFQLPKPAPSPVMHWKATFYAEPYCGRKTASGDIFDCQLLTAAHRTLPLGTRLLLKCGDRAVTVLVNDRGPWDRDPKTGRYRKDLDLSAAAFHVLSPSMTGGEGLPITAEIVKR